MKITYNAPLTLTFSLLATGLFIINQLLDGSLDGILVLNGNFNSSSFAAYVSLIGHAFGHASWEHLLGNLSLLLLLGPILEEKYGAGKLGIMALLTALITSFLHILFFDHYVLGASGIVFMCIMLVSFVNVKEREVPLTFILIFLLYVGKEIYNTTQENQISEFAHILGGICGSVFGFFWSPRDKAPESTNTKESNPLDPVILPDDPFESSEKSES